MSEYQRPLFTRRMHIAEALRAAGLSFPFTRHPLGQHGTDWQQHEAADRFHRYLWDAGFDVVRRDMHEPVLTPPVDLGQQEIMEGARPVTSKASAMRAVIEAAERTASVYAVRRAGAGAELWAHDGQAVFDLLEAVRDWRAFGDKP